MGGLAARLRRDARGFTLIEVMIVVSLLAFGLLALSAMQIQAMQGSDRGRHATNAAAIAETTMEQLQQNSWASIPDTGGFVADTAVANGVQLYGGSGLGERAYDVSHQITDLQPSFTRAIDVSVTWTEKNGDTRSITLSSVRYNREGA